MIASYLLSRTLVPTLVMLLMRNAHAARDDAKPSLLQRLYRNFDARFERVRRAYTLALSSLLAHRARFAVAFLAFCLLSCGLYPFLGRDFFPTVDAGQIRLHMRAPTGTRIEETARLADRVEAVIRELIPEEELETILDNLGVPNSGINLSYSNSGTIGTLDGEMQLSLKEGHHPTDEFVSILRAELPKRFPGRRVLLPAGRHRHADPEFRPARRDRCAIHRQQRQRERAALAAELTKQIRTIPGAVDAHVHQRLDAPAIDMQMDRSRLQQLGLNAQNVGQNVLIALSGSSQTAPAFWLNPQNGVVYSIAVQTPQYQIDSLDSLLNMPIAAGGGNSGSTAGGSNSGSTAGGGGAATTASPNGSTQLLGNLIEVSTARQPAIASRYNILPAIDVYVSVQGTDLASSGCQGAEKVDAIQKKLPRGSQVVMRGQVQTMEASFIAWAWASRWRSCWCTCWWS